MLLIKNCNLISMAGIYKEKFDILVENGKFTHIEKNIETTADMKVMDCGGKTVTPGLIEPHCHLAMSDQAGSNVNEITDPIQLTLRTVDVVNLKHKAFKRALKTGVTTLVIGPGSSNLIGGTFMAVKSAGSHVSDRMISEEHCIKMALGENPKVNYSKINVIPSTRMGTAALIRENLYKAKNYREKHMEHQAKIANGEESSFTYDLGLQSLSRAFDGMLVKIHAHQIVDILIAIRIGEEFNLNYSIDHCTEGYLMPDELKASTAKVILGPILGSKSKFELTNKSLTAPAVLEAHGIPFSITTDNPVISMDDMLTQAAYLVKNGLSEEGALRAMTIDAAKTVCLEDSIGSIEVGKDADFVIWDVEPLQTMNKAAVVMINGEIQYENGEVTYDYFKC